MSAGQVWQRPDGLAWVEVQAAAVDASGWRLMVPLVNVDDALPAPPLVVHIDPWHARVHLLTGVPERALGEPAGQLTDTQLARLRQAVQSLVGDNGSTTT